MRAVAAIAASLLLFACTNETPLEPRAASTLVVGTTEANITLDPAACFELFCAHGLLPNIHLGLLRHPRDGTTPEPALAESWEASDDAQTFTFRLREGATLHDGTRVTAEVVKASLERMRAIERPGGPGFVFFDTVEPDEPRHGIEEISTPDERTVEIRLAAPDSSFPARMAFSAAAVVSPDAFPASEPAARDASGGAGPYRLRSVSADGTLDLVRFDDYVGERPRLRRARIRPYTSLDALRQAMRSGEVQLAVGTWTPAEVGELERTRRVEIVSGPGPGLRFLGFNVSAEEFDDRTARRAATAAVNRQALADVLDGTAEPLWSLLPEGVEGHEAVFEGVEPVERGDDADPVDLWYTPTHYGENEQALAEALAEALSNSGRFEVSLRSTEWAAYKGALTEGRLPAFLLGYVPDVLDPLAYLGPLLASPTAAAVGSNYSDDDTDALVEELRASTDPARRADLVARLHRIAATQLPYVPLVQPQRHVAARRGVDAPRPSVAYWMPLWEASVG